jgi:phospholipase/carboxylesterase
MLDHEFIAAPEKNSRHLWIMLHGLGDSIEGYRFLPEIMDLPWMNFLLVNAPDTYYQGFSWFDFDFDRDGNIVPDVERSRPGVERSRRLLTELLDAQRAKGFPTSQTVLGGFSQGCLMSVDVGLRYPHRLAGIIGISGFVFEPERLLKELSPVAREQRLLLTHGTYDPIFPISKVRERIALLKNARLNIEFREFSKAHTIAGKEELNVLHDFVCAAATASRR